MRFAAMAALAVAALPLCASIPRGHMGSGVPQHSGNCNRTDGAGNSVRCTYNALGQLTSLNLRESVSSVDYSYDALGNRIVCGDRILIPDHADPLKRPLVEADASGAPIRYYIWGGGQLLGFINAASGVLTVAHCDEVGSVVALTDASGNVLYEACYGPYGEDWGSAGANPTPFAWLGGYGVFNVGGGSLYLTRHRLYSASLCRFLSQDPLGLDGGPNLYAYCMGNPLAYIDPQGLAISAASMASGGRWYDTLSNLFSSEIAWSKDYINNSGMPWVLNGALNTGLDLIGGIASIPSAIGHLGEGTGAFSANPSWQNFSGVVSDALVVGSVLSATASALPSVTGSRAAAANAAASKIDDATSAHMPVGRQGAPLQNTPYQPVRNTPAQIGGQSYSGHALDQMQNRGIPPSVVENTIRTGQPFAGNTTGTIGYYDAVNNVSVIQNAQTGNIITVRPGPP